ncbi:DUF1801 domain-containing protein [Cyclobacterium marinum]|uniref:YdhG-like domain-containing protein n=1 Tax=Cyclobacterium marinum (strain ATCC 25205 / DSM 745 / LMG 13164 / NCIMB 1802) TaxID=880070 RepID=G0J344_CYCMS|nr:DUF1801 domain-containing protein [Cyclobacterium marinum]AEL28340.1 Domain of unknown function DUF1801 [Cyclobacterium marinum DSM 745]MBI0398196.1 DUF1801 domain-containing protein [Cyclobacterium marinum]MBR9777149.1 DUF1801 domain-containing protein [Cytophagales bacterium]|tara:strand:- start:1306 stop:1761 length:456 start_codon:yes stop_codon:yes gene_type:complete
MNSKATSVEAYLEEIPDERKEAFNKLRQTILSNLPEGFEETMSYGMIGYVVPHSAYPAGYHCNPKLPLPFVNIANQKNYLALYHSCIYADSELMRWFKEEFPKHSKAKLDMGKSCIRLKKMDQIPFDLIGELITKVSMQEWINTYENSIKK